MTIHVPIRTEAELMHRPMAAGRNRAVLLGCRTAGGTMVDCVVKFAACLQGWAPVPYLTEWCAVAFGRLLGINIPEAYEVEITKPFAMSLEEPWRGIASASLGVAFGSKLCTGGFMQWTPGSLIPVDLRADALALIAFDVFIHNPDRRTDNPNVLASKQSLLAFDHGDAFSFLLPILGGNDPAEDHCQDILDHHVFGRGLGRKIPPLDTFRTFVEAITDDQIEAIGRATPTSWQGGTASGKLAILMDVMRRRRDAIGRWLPYVEARVER